jgi:hypothetical protein
MATKSRMTFGRLVPKTALAWLLLALAVVVPNLRAQEQEQKFHWMPAEAGNDALKGQNADMTPPPEIIITHVPKATADMAKFDKVYVLDLAKFGISNNGTNPVETTQGINAALQDAKTRGANRIVFPKGTYLISESDPVILDHKNTIIDLNGATLQMNTNGQPVYRMVEIMTGAENLRLTNGTLKGDRETHDYETQKDSHELCTALDVYSGRGLEVDHLTVRDFPGFTVMSESYGNRSRDELLKMIIHSVYAKELESGAFTEQGEKREDKEKIRTIKPYDVTQSNGEFEFGFSGGYQGYPEIKTRNYQAYFYDKEMKFIEKKVCLQYKKIAVPQNAALMNMEFNQPALPADPETWCGRVSNYKPPTDVHFHDNYICNNRALGLAICGGQKWLIEDNVFEKNGGQAPSYAIDYEDGWDLTQNIVLRHNKFKDNDNDLVVCAGSELLFEGNEFSKDVTIYHRTYNYIFKKNRFVGGNVDYMTVTGIAQLQDNYYERCPVAITFFNKKTIGDGFLHKEGERIRTPSVVFENETFVNAGPITGTYFDLRNCRVTGSRFVAGKETSLARFKNCQLSDSVIEYDGDGPDVHVEFENCKGALEAKGPGLKRRIPRPQASWRR